MRLRAGPSTARSPIPAANRSTGCATLAILSPRLLFPLRGQPFIDRRPGTLYFFAFEGISELAANGNRNENLLERPPSSPRATRFFTLGNSLRLRVLLRDAAATDGRPARCSLCLLRGHARPFEYLQLFSLSSPAEGMSRKSTSVTSPRAAFDLARYLFLASYHIGPVTQHRT